MNRNDLINKIAPKFGGDKKIAALAVQSVLGAITGAVASGDRVAVHGFGSFELVHKPERLWFSPAKGERITLPESWTMKYKPAGALTEFLAAKQTTAKAA